MFVSELVMIYFIQGPGSGNNKQNAIVLTWWFDLYNVMQWLEVQRCSVCKSSTSTEKKNESTDNYFLTLYCTPLSSPSSLALAHPSPLFYTPTVLNRLKDTNSKWVLMFCFHRHRLTSKLKMLLHYSTANSPSVIWGLQNFRAWCCLWKRLETLI